MFLSQVERGEKSISLNTLMSICNMTGISSDYILFGDEKNSSTANRTLKLLNQLPPEANSLIFSITNSIKDIYKKK